MILNTKEFNIIGDGVQHNTLELMELRDHIRKGPDGVWLVDFEPGHYLYNDERWLNFGNRTVILEFNNSTVECAARPFLPLGAGPLLWEAEHPADRKQANTMFVEGHLIETARVGAREVRLQRAAPGHYSAGDMVLVAGFLQQLSEDGNAGWGWPPNFRYFGWHRIAGMPDDQTVQLVEPLRYTYDASWPDFPTDFFGAPRIYGAPRIWRGRLDDGRSITRSLTIRNAKFIAGRSRPAGTETPLSGRAWHVRFEHCTLGPNTLVWPAIAYRTEFVDCRFESRQIELDKIAERLSLERCEIYGEVGGGGGGVLDVTFRDCDFYGFVRGLTPRRSWRFEGACHFYNGVHLSRGLTNTPFALNGTTAAV
jgi:hypothetical protein